MLTVLTGAAHPNASTVKAAKGITQDNRVVVLPKK
jgi:hypothetical protein